jgi:hypothetical protein
LVFKKNANFWNVEKKDAHLKFTGLPPNILRNQIKIFADSDVEAKPERAAATNFTILDEEPSLVQGLAGAIKLASTKGYFESKDKEVKGGNLAHLQAKSYTIEDKLKDDDRR